jgi:glycosyltransferase involved in cell wall biosynthesis
MNSPNITAVIPTYHRPDLLARAIKSVQLQGFEDWECFVFSDHCPKAHLVYKIYFSDDSRIRFIENPNKWEHNVGAVGVNYALKNARSNVITYLCDDNIFLPNHFDTILTNISSNIDVVETNSHSVKIKKGNGGIKEILNREFLKDIDTSALENQAGGSDMIRLGHKIDIIKNGIGYWESSYELKKRGHQASHQEDDVFIDRLKEKTKTDKWTSVKDFTSVYYARKACNIRDEDYHSRVSNLRNDEVFVYPDIVEKILQTNNVRNI